MDATERVGVGLGVEDGDGLLFGDRQAATDKAPVFFGLAHLTFIADTTGTDGVE